jgi:hypothetical protein
MNKIELAKAYKAPYVWPGGYPVHLVLADGELLCRRCFRSEYRQLVWDLDNKCNTGWLPVGTDVLYEGPAYCAYCSDKLESAYGDIDE